MEDGLFYEIKYGDALKRIKEIPDASVDLVLTDPPFDISDKSRLTKKGGKIVQGELFDWEIENYDDYMHELFKEYWRILKESGNFVIFYSYHKIGLFNLFIEQLGFIFLNTIVLYKKNPIPHITRTNLRSSMEQGFWFCKDKKKRTFNFLSQKEMCNVYPYHIAQKETNHPAEKPIYIYKWIVKFTTNPHDIVVDSFLGSGTTLLACLQAERSCIGIELNKEYIRLIRKRTIPYFRKNVFGENPYKLRITKGEGHKNEDKNV